MSSSGGSFTFGAPSPAASSASQNSYSGSFVSSASISASDSVSNVGVMLQNVQLTPYVASGGSGAAGGPSVTTSNVLFGDYFNRGYSDTRVRADTFVDWSKDALTYAGGSIFKAAHNNGVRRRMMMAFHMQYLHIIDINTEKLTDAAKAIRIGQLNTFLFDEHVKIQTNWGACSFYKNYKNFIAKPVIASVYNGDLEAELFKSTKDGPEEPLSVACFADWLARH